MKSRFLKILGLTAALAVPGVIGLGGQRAQQTVKRPVSPPMTTNWMGYLVIGAEDNEDRLAIGPHPTTVSRVQIGLRSDGVVVWRGVSNSP